MELVPALLLTGYVTSSKPQFPHLWNRNNNTAYLVGYREDYEDNAEEAQHRAWYKAVLEC